MDLDARGIVPCPWHSVLQALIVRLVLHALNDDGAPDGTTVMAAPAKQTTPCLRRCSSQLKRPRMAGETAGCRSPGSRLGSRGTPTGERRTPGHARFHTTEREGGG
jgi:hypothetical protein